MPQTMKMMEFEPYFNWLYEKIERRGQIRDFKAFLQDLSRIEFYSLIPNDDNRSVDGLKFRDEFGDISGGFFVPPGPCTLIEMLIALAERMDFILCDIDNSEKTAKWFWKFVDNLRLEIYHQHDFDINRKRRENREKIDIFLERKYMDTGQGGLFPLLNPLKDQRETELWYQMMYYIDENYQI